MSNIKNQDQKKQQHNQQKIQQQKTRLEHGPKKQNPNILQGDLKNQDHENVESLYQDHEHPESRMTR